MTKQERQQRALSNVLSEHTESFFIVATTPDGNMHGFQKYASMRDKYAIEYILEKYFMNKLESDNENLNDEED